MKAHRVAKSIDIKHRLNRQAVVRRGYPD